MAEQTLTVSELGVIVRAALEAAMPYGVWVEGTIAGLNRSRNGHVYFDLTEPSDTAGEAPVASVPVVLFRDNKARVNKTLTRHGNPIRMDDGVKIRIQGVVDYYPPQGRVQLRMSAIDPTYTLGLIAADRDVLLAELNESGQLDANATRPVPPVPLRIGLVTSLGSAAHADITTVLTNSGRSFHIIEIDSAVQGAGAENQLAAAITTAANADVDVVLVARGGGSKTDLAVFDHRAVALAIAGSSRPVFTGIGHDIDSSVADAVAHTSFTTPTAAAQGVVERVNDWLTRLGSVQANIANASRAAIDRADDRLRINREQLGTAAIAATTTADARLARSSTRLAQRAVRAETVANATLDRAADRLALAARHRLRGQELRIDAIASQVDALDPARVLARGWSITRNANGDVVRSTKDAAPGEQIVTVVADGEITSTIDSHE